MRSDDMRQQWAVEAKEANGRCQMMSNRVRRNVDPTDGSGKQGTGSERGARRESGRGESISANVGLCGKWKVLKIDIIILMTLHMEKRDRQRKR